MKPVHEVEPVGFVHEPYQAPLLLTSVPFWK
jgi:hypothetical protein